MTNRSTSATFASLALLLCACTSPNEKPAQEKLTEAREQDRRGNLSDAIALLKSLREDYPGTKAARDAERLQKDVGGRLDAKSKRLASLLQSTPSPLAPLESSSDDMKQRTWYWAAGTSSLAQKPHLNFYFGIRERNELPELMPLRLLVQIQTTNALSARTLLIKTGRKVHEFSAWTLCEQLKPYEFGFNWGQSCDLALTSEHPELLLAILDAQDLKVRIEGSGEQFSDFIVPNDQLEMAKRLYGTWKLLDEGARPDSSAALPR